MTSSPQISIVSPSFFLNMLRAGAKRVISKENMLNQINVFPVNDRDTGSNMASLMRYFLSQSYSTSDLSALLGQIADAALLGACGNSGMILSAFFLGFSSKQNFYQKDELTTNEFIECLQHGVKQAYQAVSKPVEGTMLTIMSAWSKACDQLRQQSKDFIHIFQKSIPIVEGALQETKNQLAVLSRNNTVDAGAAGFLELIYGMQDYLLKPEPMQYEHEVHLTDSPSILIDHSHNDDHEPNYHYCAETLLACEKQDITKMRQCLEAFGDSLVVNQSPHYVKTHIHTDDVLTMTNNLKQFGAIQHQKIDSMRAQWQVAHARKYPIAIVTDSSADIPKDWLEREQIHVLPLQIRLGHNTMLDKLTISLTDLFDGIHHQHQIAKTSMTSPEIANRYIQYLATHYESIIVIPISSQLSGTHQMLTQLAKKIDRVRVDVIDSKRNSAAQGLLVMLASKWVASGLNHDQVLSNIGAAIKNTNMFVAVNEFETLAKSGRAPQALNWFGKWTHLKPVLKLSNDGRPELAGFAIGQRMCWNKIVKLLHKIKKTQGIQSISIVYSSTRQQANKFAQFIEEKTKLKVNYLMETSCAIALNAGQGSLGVAFSLGALN